MNDPGEKEADGLKQLAISELGLGEVVRGARR
jgi:hypothetical protein